MRRLFTVAAVVFAAASLSGIARAEPRPSHWLRQHGSAELVFAAAGIRAGIGTDTIAPGFDAFAGGAELDAGLEIGSGVGIVASGRVLAGSQAGNNYLEGLGALVVQVRVSETVRLRAGPAAGQATLGSDSAVLVGGYMAGSIDLFALGSGRLSTALTVRLDVDAMLGARKLLPDRSLGFSLGVGVRY